MVNYQGFTHYLINWGKYIDSLQYDVIFYLLYGYLSFIILHNNYYIRIKITQHPVYQMKVCADTPNQRKLKYKLALSNATKVSHLNILHPIELFVLSSLKIQMTYFNHFTEGSEEVL